MDLGQRENTFLLVAGFAPIVALLAARLWEGKPGIVPFGRQLVHHAHAGRRLDSFAR